MTSKFQLSTEAAELAGELIKRSWDKRRKEQYRNRCHTLKQRAIARLHRREIAEKEYIGSL